MLSIAAVERDTGISKDTLRVWERRYGFPQPSRDAFGERLYPPEQVDKLRLIQRLMNRGHRPGKIIAHPVETLQQMVQDQPALAHSDADGVALPDYLKLLKSHQIDDLRRALSQALLRVGLARFVTDFVAPLNAIIGDAWTRGEIEIFEEHLYTESVQVILRGAINTIPEADRHPRILLTTFPQEPHGIGLLMAEALFALDGCRCISLGVQTPISDIVLAAQAQRVDIVALSFSPIVNANQVISGLTELRTRLPASIAIWAGGSCPALQRRPPPDIHVMRSLHDIHVAVAGWQGRPAASAPLEHGA